MARYHILVAEDDASVRRLVAGVLTGAGFFVDTAEDGVAAWQALQAKGYHLLITDNDMPGLSGIELIKKVRAAGMALSVILMSGTMPTEELKVLSALRISATLYKPHGIMELLKTVKEVLDGGGDSPGSPHLK